MNQVSKRNDIEEVRSITSMVHELSKSPHYQKLGEAGIFAIVSKAKAMGISPLEALNGGMYYVQGKVEMSGQTMLALIRAKGHSVTLDPGSSNEMVTLHGRRADNGDTWTVSFSIEDAKRAGIYKAVWTSYPKTMLTWRCVSMLARCLFSDVIKGCYVEGEIAEPTSIPEMEIFNVEIPSNVTIEQATEIGALFDGDPERAKKAMAWLGVSAIEEIPAEKYQPLVNMWKAKQ